MAELMRIVHATVYGHQIAEMQSALRIGPADQKKLWRDQISGCRKMLKALLK